MLPPSGTGPGHPAPISPHGVPRDVLGARGCTRLGSSACPWLIGVGFHLSSTSGTFPSPKFFNVVAAQGEAGPIFPLATGKLRQERAPTELPLLLEHPKYLSTYFPPTQSSS